MTIISVLPQNLTNGTIADATQVMANFNQIYNNVNTNAAERGANSTITSLSGLSTPLSVIQGGTGTNTATGSGSAVLATSPTLVTPTLTTPTSNNGTFNSPTLVTPALGTPASGNLANCTALPAASITAGTTGAGVNITGNAATATTATTATNTSGGTLSGSLGTLTGTLPIANGGTGSASGTPIAKAWVSANGATINKGFNISGIVRNATGDYTITFSSAMSDTTYAAIGSLLNTSQNYCVVTTPMSTTTLAVGIFNTSGSRTDANYQVVVFD